ncbi:protein LURP-one-related 17-like isoform X2 [Salvia splendens]|uniref:protein LURP-one-related 17-like isoform X2 n=1 Tax=Salvia splendens TaxID=180675 RepID=UPI001C2732DC|nr:protein LURP-one-related 17-like isoform X2 [Salvia splendens]
MIFLSKSKSRTVHHYHDESGDDGEASTSLTVWTKSLVYSCSGFTVIGSDGGLAYRVDNYTGRPDQTILMDGSGNPIFTICRRKKPMFCVRKNNMRLRQTKVDDVVAYVYCGILENRCMYVVEGSFTHRSCKILDESRRVVAEIKKKEAMPKGASFGLEVFHLIIKPGFHCKFAMAIVLLLDQMYSY